MNLSALMVEFAGLGITVTQTPQGDLSVKPRHLLTDELRGRLKAAKAEFQRQLLASTAPEQVLPSVEPAQPEPAPTLRLMEPTGSTTVGVPTGPTPVLVLLDGKEPTLDPFGISAGVWYGPGIEAMQKGICGSCGWAGVPLVSEGDGQPDSRCCVCHQADQRLAGQPLACGTFCADGQTLLLQASRFEPGGSLCCPECRETMLQIKARSHQRTNEAACDVAV